MSPAAAMQAVNTRNPFQGPASPAPSTPPPPSHKELLQLPLEQQLAPCLLAQWLPQGGVLYLDPVYLDPSTPAPPSPPDGPHQVVLDAAAHLGWQCHHVHDYVAQAGSSRPAAAGQGGQGREGGGGEAELVSRIVSDVDVCVLVDAERDAGSMAKWLGQRGVAIVRWQRLPANVQVRALWGAVSICPHLEGGR